MSIREQLRQAIQESDLSLYAIAKRAGLSQIQISRFMRGERDLVLKTASKICKVLGLELTQRQEKGHHHGNGQ